MKVIIPTVCDSMSIFTVLGQVFDEEGDCYSNRFLFDARRVTGIDPLGLVLLNNLFAWLEKQGHKLDIYLPESTTSVSSDGGIRLLDYIDESGVYPYNDAINVHEEMIPLAHVSAERSSSWVLRVFHRWVAEILGISTLSLFTPLQFVRLLFQYASQAGGSEGTLVHASMNKEDRSLRIVLAHYGKSIQDLLRSSWSSLTNHAVIIAKATEDQKGRAEDHASLLFLIEDVVIENGGQLSIYSGFGRMEGHRNHLGITQKLEMTHAFVPGALFDITFRLDVTGFMSRINEPNAGSKLQVSG